MRSCFRSLLDQPQVHCVKRNKQDAESHCMASCVKSEKYWSFWDGGKWWFQETGGADGRRHWGHNPDGCKGLGSASVLLKMRKTTVNNNTLCVSKGQMRGCWRWFLFYFMFLCVYYMYVSKCMSHEWRCLSAGWVQMCYVGSPVTGVLGACAPPGVCVRNRILVSEGSANTLNCWSIAASPRLDFECSFQKTIVDVWGYGCANCTNLIIALLNTHENNTYSTDMYSYDDPTIIL